MNKPLLIGYFAASAWFWAFEAIRALLSKYNNYAFTVYYANTFGVWEWIGDFIGFTVMAWLSVIFIISVFKTKDDTANAGGA